MTQITLPLQSQPAKQTASNLAPLRPLTSRQRIGYLDQCTELECLNPIGNFTPGRSYRVFTTTLRAIRFEKKRNLMGQWDDVQLDANEMAVFVEDDNRRARCFMNERFHGGRTIVSDGTAIDYGFDKLASCFRLPDVPDVAELYPETVARNIERVGALESWMKAIDPAFALREWQTGDLARAAVRDGFILGWATGLGKGIGIFAWPLIKVGWGFCETGLIPNKPILIVALGDLHAQFEVEAMRRFGIRMLRLDRKTASLRPGFYLTSFTEATGQERVMALCRQFECVAVDEATKIKAEDSNIGERIRSLNPRYRMLATATAIKNRLPDLFSLLWWAAGGQPTAHIGFPYRDTAGDRERFTNTFMVMERNLTKERAAKRQGRSQKFMRPTAEACNLQRLWRMTAPLILRRRKEEVAAIVKRIPHRVAVPMGVHQAETYRRVLEFDWVDDNGKPLTGVKLQKLRQVAACPNSANLEVFRSAFDYTPKIAAVLSIAAHKVHTGEQVLIFSAFLETTDCVSRRLNEAGIRHCICDGREDYAARGLMAKQFRAGKLPVMLAGEGSMSYGHDFPDVNNIILTSKDWAMDLQEQAVSRGHRLASKRDVNVYSILCKGSIDEPIEALLDEKEATSQMVLDGEESDLEVTDADLAELLEDAVHNFGSASGFVDEQQLIKEWRTR